MSNEVVQSKRQSVFIWLGLGLIVAAVILMTVSVANARARHIEPGAYAITILPSDLPPNYPPQFAELTPGNYIIEFRQNGDIFGYKEGVEVVYGRYFDFPGRVVFRDVSGPFACFEPGTVVGLYNWSQSGDELTLTPERERCIARQAVFNAKPLVKQ